MRIITNNKNVIQAVHGQYCSGCSATSGNCGMLTKQMQGNIAPLRVTGATIQVRYGI
jgi:hypothetical protein